VASTIAEPLLPPSSTIANVINNTSGQSLGRDAFGDLDDEDYEWLRDICTFPRLLMPMPELNVSNVANDAVLTADACTQVGLAPEFWDRDLGTPPSSPLPLMRGGESTPENDGDESDSGRTIPFHIHLLAKWWLSPNGVHGHFLRVRPRSGAATVAYCKETVMWLLRSSHAAGRHARFKIGMCTDPWRRYGMYSEGDPEGFQQMFLLYKSASREAANFLELLIIDKVWFAPGCVNRERRDRGGTGNGPLGTSFVYAVAVSSL
jgi:hypothetical protein